MSATEMWMRTTKGIHGTSRARNGISLPADHRLLAILLLSLILAACNSALAGKEYIGHWENSKLKQQDTLDITRDGEHFLIKKTTAHQVTTYPATLKDGILQLADGSAIPFTYVKATDALIVPGVVGDIEYHRTQ